MVETAPISVPEMSVKKEKLVLRKVVDGKPQSLHITVAFNPTCLKEEDVIRYLETVEMGAVNFAREFRSRPSAILNFNFILDATGANQPADEETIGISDSVKICLLYTSPSPRD